MVKRQEEDQSEKKEKSESENQPKGKRQEGELGPSNWGCSPILFHKQVLGDETFETNILKARVWGK